MTYQTITVRKLNPYIGAEIEGVDLSKPLSDRQVAEIRQAWMDHIVIAFRDQALTVEQHLEFGRLFGELHVHPATLQPEDHPEILVIHADENSTRVAGEDWHTDVSCEEKPPMGSLLYMSEVPPDGGGDTLFASMYAAYETLSEPIKKMLIGMTAIHDGKAVYDRPGYREDRTYPRAKHPVVRTHPETGRQSLFVNRVFTTQIVGLNRDESDAILQMLYRHVETPELAMRFRWKPGTLVCWDNRCAQHRALWDYFPNRRHGQRVTVNGDKPFYKSDADIPSGREAKGPVRETPKLYSLRPK